jgi:hypothetical protein
MNLSDSGPLSNQRHMAWFGRDCRLDKTGVVVVDSGPLSGTGGEDRGGSTPQQWGLCSNSGEIEELSFQARAGRLVALDDGS